MAQRRFKIPGKIVSSTTGAVSSGNAGTKGIIVDDGGSTGNGLIATVADLGLGTGTQQITFHGWFYPTSTAVREWIILADDSNTAFWAFLQHLSGNLRIIFHNSSDTQIFAWLTGDDTFTVNKWNSILFSIDFNAQVMSLYVNDVQITGNPSVPNDTIPLNVSDTIMGIYAHNLASSGEFFGDASVIWIDFDRYIDFTVTANRRLFIDANKRPVALGTLGQIPTGTSPLFYFDNNAANYNINFGTAPNFDFISGSEIGTNAFQDTNNNPATGTLA